jgi:hypothetical protein
VHRATAALKAPQLVKSALVVVQQNQLGGPLVRPCMIALLEREVEDVDRAALQWRQVLQRW